jgi:hypothetical protein
VSLLCLDWRTAAGTLPALAALCASNRGLTKQRLRGNVEDVLNAIEQHPEFRNTLDGIKCALTSPQVGFSLAREAAKRWLEHSVSTETSARSNLRNHADIKSPNAHCIPRPAIETALTAWWTNGPKSPAVLLGDEERGKTWVMLSWCLNHLTGGEAPMILAAPAKEIPPGHVQRKRFDFFQRVSRGCK